MDAKKVTFKKAAKTDKQLIQEWLKKPHVKEYWNKKIGDDSECWICSYEKKPFGLILTSDAVKPDHDEEIELDYFIPWTEAEGKTLLIDFAIGEKAFLGKGLASETLQQFAQIQDPSITAFLADPEAKNEKALHVFEKAGFVKVSTFIRGKGFFQGKPHYLLKLKILHNTSP